MSVKQRIGAAALTAVLATAGYLVGPFEGKRNTVYPDIVHGWNAPTICRGHVDVSMKPGTTLTDAECDELFSADLESTFNGLAKCIPVETMNVNEMAAYLSVSYNGGFAAICNSSIPKKLTAGDHAAACATISDFYNAGWVRPPATLGRLDKGVRRDCRIAANNCAGIVRRRAAERALCEAPVALQ